MRSTFTPKQAALAVVCALAFSVFSTTSVAQPRDINEKALLLDTRGGPVMSGTGLCWHTAYGPAPVWTSGCHAAVPTPVAQYVAPAPQPVVQQPIAQPIAAPAPTPAPVISSLEPSLAREKWPEMGQKPLFTSFTTSLPTLNVQSPLRLVFLGADSRKPKAESLIRRDR